MTVGPRIVFVRFLRDDSPKLVPWRVHISRVLGAAGTSSTRDANGQLVWQLVSGNNRQLARSVRVYSSFEEASDEAKALVESAASLEVTPVSEPRHGVYGWYASIGGEPVMACARWYFTDRDRRHSIQLAVRSLETTTLHVGARLTDPELMAGTNAV